MSRYVRHTHTDTHEQQSQHISSSYCIIKSHDIKAIQAIDYLYVDFVIVKSLQSDRKRPSQVDAPQRPRPHCPCWLSVYLGLCTRKGEREGEGRGGRERVSERGREKEGGKRRERERERERERIVNYRI